MNIPLIYKAGKINALFFRHFFLGVLLFSLAATGIALNPGPVDQYIHRHWTSRQGLPHNTVTSFARDNQGFIWLGTLKGLARFDGTQFLVFNSANTPALRNDSITALTVTPDGTLWIGTNGGGIVAFRHQRFFSYFEGNGLRSNFIRSITVKSDDNIYFGTEGGGIVRWNGKSFKTRTFAKFLAGNPIYSLFHDKKQSLHAGTGCGLLSIKNGKSSLLSIKNGLPGNTIRTVLEDSKGNLWAGSMNGLGLRPKSRKQFSPLSPRNILTHECIYSILEDKDGLIWVATGSGLKRLAPQKNGGFETQNLSLPFLSKSPVLSLFEDEAGTLWAGTGGNGFFSLRNSNFSLFNTEDGLSINHATAIHEDENGTLWIGTGGGGLNRLSNGAVSVLTTKDGLSSNFISAICSDKKGTLWIGTSGGLNSLANNSIKSYKKKGPSHNISNNTPHRTISALYIDSKGVLFTGSYGGGVNFYKNGKFHTPDSIMGQRLSNNVVLSLAGDITGSVWVGTKKGLYCIRNYHLMDFINQESLADFMIHDIHCDLAGDLWLATNNHGLLYWTGMNIFAYKSDPLFSGSGLYKIIKQSNGFLWLSSNSGLFTLNTMEFTRFARPKNKPIQYFHFEESLGLKRNAFSSGAGCLRKNGEIWLPGSNGITVFYPDTMPLRNNEIPVFIDKMINNGKSIFFKKEKKPLEHVFFDNGTIEFQFSALNLNGRENLNFKCSLAKTPDLIVIRENITNKRSITYSNLPSGDFRFSVSAGYGEKEWYQLGENKYYDFYMRSGSNWGETFIFILVFLTPIVLVIISKRRARLAQDEEMLKIFQDDVRYKTSAMSNKNSRKCLMDLVKLMTEEKLYLDPNITVGKLAKRLNVSKEHISQSINKGLYMNFNKFLNKYRIEDAKQMLKDPKKNQYVLLKIAHDVGFNSKSTFNAAFKKITGISPSEYKKKHQPNIKE
ncbi:MAG: helix-turn-helix domain-containing protein [bacterium]|nr:helix-turn-helix domain-containing protein [bacterium]